MWVQQQLMMNRRVSEIGIDNAIDLTILARKLTKNNTRIAITKQRKEMVRFEI